MSDFSRTNTESQLYLNNYSEQSPSSPSKFSMIGNMITHHQNGGALNNGGVEITIESAATDFNHI